MIIDLSCYPTQVVDTAWRHDGDPFTGERLLKMMDGPYYVNGKPRRIDKAFIQPPQGNTLHHFTNDHLDHREGIRAYMAYTVELVRSTPTASSAASSTTRATVSRTAWKSSSGT
jgi:predicted TIM-barrel fold metal-dependent hydrolase